MEGTVLRVPCIPSGQPRGLWRSSARRLGPPPSTSALPAGPRLPLFGRYLAVDALGLAHRLSEPVARRVARLIARTRSGRCVTVRSAGARREASPHADIPFDPQAWPPIKISYLQSSPPSQSEDVGRFNDVSGRFERPKASQSVQTHRERPACQCCTSCA
jgi:hypothetical protein